MNRDDIIRMAREAGCIKEDWLEVNTRFLERFANLVAAHNRKPLTDEEIDRIIASNVTITDQNLHGAVYMAMRELEERYLK